MSGSNPFRPRKQPEALPTTANSTDLSAVSPTTVPSRPAVAAPTSDDVPHQPHIPASSSSTVDDTASSDDEDSTADPFGQASHLSDDGGNDHNEHDGPSTKNSVPVASPPRRPLPVPPTGSRTASTSSSTDARSASISGSTVARRPSNASIDSRSLANRSVNKEKKPPPPPKSHHGKLINPPSPVESSKRLSFQGSSPAIQYSGPDYFTPGPNNNDDEKDLNERTPPDSLRRSQSHYKRPPTPPLSRRHSQMRRSKSSLSQTNPTRSPPSPGTVSLAPSTRQAPSRSSLSLQTDDNNTSSREDHHPAPSSPTVEMSSPGKISARQTAAQGAPSAAAAAAAATAPPPPPPRRAARPASTMLPSKPGQEEGLPHPSNANHILEDLSRLQKEVDDLRGRYENRKSVNI